MTETTRNKIIEATIELVNKHGYKGATTRSIAERAGVNEVTLFRNFGSKKGIVEAAIESYSDMDILSDTFERRIIWDVKADLEMLARAYHHLLEKKRDLILISFKEAGAFPELDKLISFIPLAYKDKLMAYFLEMIKQEKINSVDVEGIATNFIFINFGYFMLKSRLGLVEEGIGLDEFIDQNITLFIESIV